MWSELLKLLPITINKWQPRWFVIAYSTLLSLTPPTPSSHAIHVPCRNSPILWNSPGAIPWSSSCRYKTTILPTASLLLRGWIFHHSQVATCSERVCSFNPSVINMWITRKSPHVHREGSHPYSSEKKTSMNLAVYPFWRRGAVSRPDADYVFFTAVISWSVGMWLAASRTFIFAYTEGYPLQLRHVRNVWCLLYFKMSCVYCCSCLVCIVVVLCVLL